MEKEQIKEKVFAVIKDKLSDDKKVITEDSKFSEDLGFDSLDQADIGMELEEEFNVDISPEDEGKIKTVGDTLRIIEEKLKTK